MMNCQQIWNTLLSELSLTELELQTTTGLWFKAYVKNDRLFVDKTIDNTPSSQIAKPRTITKNDFLMVCSYYDRWINGESGIRHEVSIKSRNTAYIFGLIEKFK